MSDSVTQIEIEDVLSSIRRLVSEDARPKPALNPTGPQDRLVLTPSQRVEADPAGEAVHKETPSDPGQGAVADADKSDLADAIRAEVADVVRNDNTAPVDLPTEQSASPIEAIARLVERAVEQEVGSALASSDMKAPVTKNPAHHSPVQQSNAKPATDKVDGREEVDAGVHNTPTGRSALELKIAELEALISKQSSALSEDAYESQQDRASADMPGDQDGELAEPSEEPLNLGSVSGVGKDVSVDAFSHPEAEIDLDVEPEDLPGKVVELVSFARTDNQSADVVDMGGRDPVQEDVAAVAPVRPLQASEDAPEVETEDDTASAEVPSEVAQVVEEAEGGEDLADSAVEDDATDAKAATFVHSPKLSVVPDETPSFDPEDLRALVSQLVREELQSELGERITRNVRKLVRREIQRALMNHSLD